MQSKQESHDLQIRALSQCVHFTKTLRFCLDFTCTRKCVEIIKNTNVTSNVKIFTQKMQLCTLYLLTPCYQGELFFPCILVLFVFASRHLSLTKTCLYSDCNVYLVHYSPLLKYAGYSGVTKPSFFFNFNGPPNLQDRLYNMKFKTF